MKYAAAAVEPDPLWRSRVEGSLKMGELHDLPAVKVGEVMVHYKQLSENVALYIDNGMSPSAFSPTADATTIHAVASAYIDGRDRGKVLGRDILLGDIKRLLRI